MSRYIGKGAAIAVKTSESPETYTNFGQVRAFGGISFTSDEVEVTTIDDDYRQFRQSVKDGGECPITVIFDPALTTHIGGTKSLKALFDSGDVVDFRIYIPSSPAYGLFFSGYVMSIEWDEFSNENAVVMTGTLRVQGSPSLSAI